MSTVFESLNQLFVLLETELVHLVHKTLDITHAEQFLHKRLDTEGFEVVDVLACSDEYHRTFCRRHTEIQHFSFIRSMFNHQID